MKKTWTAFFAVLALSPAMDARAAEVTTGWTDLLTYIVPSNGSYSLGNTSATFNSTRDPGSKIVYFNAVSGDNATAVVYWWNGSAIVDSNGSTTNGSGQAYGTDPLFPIESAIKPFKNAVGIIRNAVGDGRLRTHYNQDFATVAGGYPDWFLFRRGQTHTEFDGDIDGGKSENEPMVIAGYGPRADGFAAIEPAIGTQVVFNGQSRGVAEPFDAGWPSGSAQYQHEVMVGLSLPVDVSHLESQNGNSLAGGPPTLLVEDCRMRNGHFVFLPRKSIVRRSSFAFRWKPLLSDGNFDFNEAYFTNGGNASVTFEDMIFYKNGYEVVDPRTVPDPYRSKFSRNIYQGGGAQMGHVYRNMISADGGSGGPQMRYGGLIENSLIIEGSWYSSTLSNNNRASWVAISGQTGQSAVVRNNVQLIYAYPTNVDPDTKSPPSPSGSQPGWGYRLEGASFGAVVENNIISGAMVGDELASGSAAGFTIQPSTGSYGGTIYTQKDNVFQNNIAYRTGMALELDNDWAGVVGNVVQNNVFVPNGSILRLSQSSLTDNSQLNVTNNRFYSDTPTLPSQPWMGANTLAPRADAAAVEGWTDPDRTLKRYVQEVLGLTLLDWADDPWVVPGAAAGEPYDPTGMKTFMAVAVNMRRGGVTPAPSGGKPSWTGDYAWDDRYAAVAVVNWIRAGFGLPPVSSTGGGPSDTMPPAVPLDFRQLP